MAPKKARKEKKADELRGQLMLQIAAGRYFRSDVPIGEHIHRRTLHSNAWLADGGPVELPVGTITGGTELDEVSTAMVEAVDRLETKRMDGTDDFLIATSGDELIDDIAYVLTFVLNRTFSRDGDQVRRLVPHEGTMGRRRAGAALFPGLFDPRQVVRPDEMNDVTEFMVGLLELHRDDFARVMRVIRSTVDATRRAIDDPTGAYTDLVAALESLADDDLTTSTTWDRYEGRKRKIFDAVLVGRDPELGEMIREAVLEADRAGLKRRFIASTLSRISPEYYRTEAVGVLRPPPSADVERMLGIAYDIRSRRSHVLQDLGEEAWGFSDGAEVAFEPNFERIFTLAGLWRLVRHVVRRYVADTPKAEAEPWDYRMSLPGIITAPLAPQYWIGQDLGAAQALQRFNGVADALIAWHSGHNDEGFSLDRVAAKIETLVPPMPDSETKTALIAIHRLWHEWTDPGTHRPEARTFIETYEGCLQEPSPTAFTVATLSNFAPREWTLQEWADLADARRAERVAGKAAPLPAKIDALLHLKAADWMEAEGRHDEALTYAANAVEECPGNSELLAWEARLLAGDHDPLFAVHPFLFDRNPIEKDSDQATGHAVEDRVSEGGGPAEETRGACDVETPWEPPEIEVPSNE
jgi:hypothetical protein